MGAMDDRQRAARAVDARLGELGLTQQQLADKAGVDVKTVHSLIRRGRWPIARTRGRIEAALGWPSGELARIAADDDDRPPPVPPELEAYPALVEDIRRRYPRPDDYVPMLEAIAATLRGDPPPTSPAEEDPSRQRRHAG